MAEKWLQWGTAEEIMKNEKSITGAYLSGRMKIPVPEEAETNRMDSR